MNDTSIPYTAWHVDQRTKKISELEDFLTFPQDEAPTLSLLDSTLRRFVVLCSTYHGVFFLMLLEFG